jgi:hypothetical protein
MLISKGYSANDILCFKLTNGEEVVAKLIEEKSDCFVVTRPCTVIPSQQGLGLMQTLISGELNTNISLNKMHIIMHSTVISDIEKHYIKTTTGLQL